MRESKSLGVKTPEANSTLVVLKARPTRLEIFSETCKAARGSGRGLPGLAQKIFDSLAVLLGVVESEMDFRCAAKLDAFGQLVANVADGCREATDRGLLLGLVSHHADEDARMLEVRRDADFGDGDEGGDARVFQLTGDHNAQLVENLLGDAFVAVSPDRHCFFSFFFDFYYFFYLSFSLKF